MGSLQVQDIRAGCATGLSGPWWMWGSGGRELVAWFGYAPRFHDAECSGWRYRDGATCAVRVHGFEMTNEVDAKGLFPLHQGRRRHVPYGRPDELELHDFADQNALMGLSIAGDADVGLRLELDPANGVSGFVTGRTLQITIEPGKPPGSQYSKFG